MPGAASIEQCHRAFVMGLTSGPPLDVQLHLGHGPAVFVGGVGPAFGCTALTQCELLDSAGDSGRYPHT